jgi:hypothetical protein
MALFWLALSDRSWKGLPTRKVGWEIIFKNVTVGNIHCVRKVAVHL